MVSHTRRRYNKKFKEEAVKLVVEESLSVVEAERRLNTGRGVANGWVERFYRENGQDRLPANEPEKLKGEISKLTKNLEQVNQERDALLVCVRTLTSSDSPKK